MSQATALSFLKEAESNQELRRKIEVAFDKEREQWQYEQLITLAAEAGYTFSADDFTAAIQEMSDNDELSDDQLAGIAGGTGWWGPPVRS